MARRMDGAAIGPAVVARIGGKWRQADLPDGSMSELVIDRWMDIPPVKVIKQKRRKKSRRP
jgi:hypothetical protein